MQGSPDASSPAWLAQAGEYVAITQQELGEARRQVEALQAEKSALQLQLMVARQEQAGQVANLQADVASLQARLELAGSTARSCDGALQDARQWLQEERAAAEQATASSRQEQAGLRERVRLLEARCAEQAQQLQALAGLQQQVQQQGQALQRSQQDQQAAQQRHQKEIQALIQQRDQALEGHRRVKENAKQIAVAYTELKATYRQLKRQVQQRQRGAEAAAAAGAQGAADAPQQSSGEGDDGLCSYQLTGVSTGLGCAPQRLPSISSEEKQQPQQQQQQQQQMGPPAAEQPRGRPSSADELRVGAAVERQQVEPRRTPGPPAIADPPRADAWPMVDDTMQLLVPPTEGGEAVPASEDQAGDSGGGKGIDADEELTQELTQAVPPPAAAVRCTQLPSPPRALQQHQLQQQRQQQQQPQQAQALPAPAASSPTGRCGKRTLADAAAAAEAEAGPEAVSAAAAPPASFGSPMRPLLPRKRQALTPEGGTSAGANFQQQQQQPPPSVESPAAGREVAAPSSKQPDLPLALAAEAACRTEQAAGSGWPSSRPSLQQQQQQPQQQPQPQQRNGGAWKQAVRATHAAYAAFEFDGPPGYAQRPPPSAAATAAAAGVAGGPRQQGAVGGGYNGSNSGAGGGTGGGTGGGGRGEPGYRYQDVVRKKAEREKLQGFECQQCQRFYEAVESWSADGQQQLKLACGHVQQQQQRQPGGSAAPGAPGAAAAVASREQMRLEGSRHRYRYEPAATQEGFWDMDVTQKTPAKRQAGQQQQQHRRQQEEEKQEEEKQEEAPQWRPPGGDQETPLWQQQRYQQQGLAQQPPPGVQLVWQAETETEGEEP